jgi:hypothetical protein
VAGAADGGDPMMNMPWLAEHYDYVNRIDRLLLIAGFVFQLAAIWLLR